jgi:hypothetical protein
VTRDQESRSDEKRNLHDTGIEARHFSSEPAHEQEYVVVEALDLRRMPVALRILYGQRVQVEMLLKQLTLDVHRLLEEICPQDGLRLIVPGVDEFRSTLAEQVGFGIVEEGVNHRRSLLMGVAGYPGYNIK